MHPTGTDLQLRHKVGISERQRVLQLERKLQEAERSLQLANEKIDAVNKENQLLHSKVQSLSSDRGKLEKVNDELGQAYVEEYEHKIHAQQEFARCYQAYQAESKGRILAQQRAIQWHQAHRDQSDFYYNEIAQLLQDHRSTVDGLFDRILQLKQQVKQQMEERDGKILRLEQQMKERDETILRLEQQMKERDETILRLEQALELEHEDKNLVQQEKEQADQALQVANEKKEEQEQELQKLQDQNETMKDRLNKNSQNSSRPPSLDGFNKKPRNRSLRGKSNRKPGGQVGHKGSTLTRIKDPDKVVVHELPACPECGTCLRDEEALEPKKLAQVIDIASPPEDDLQDPPVTPTDEPHRPSGRRRRMKVTEHQAERKFCPVCNKEQHAPLPEGARRPVQYGPELHALVAYLSAQQKMPYHCVKEMVREFHGWNISEGTVDNILDHTDKLVRPVVEGPIKELLINTTDPKHVDETGIPINGKTYYVHNCSTGELTYQTVHEKRGREGMDHAGILPKSKGGFLIHDRYRPYYKYEGIHGLCNAHLARDLKYLFEEKGFIWARRMSCLIFEMKDRVDKCGKEGGVPSKAETEELLQRYAELVELGKKQHPPAQRPEGQKKRGRVKQSEIHNLVKAYDKLREWILAFFLNPGVPFDNNQAERDIRSLKIKVKRATTFRSLRGAKMHVRLNSYISTARKHGISVLKALRWLMHRLPTDFLGKTRPHTF